VAGSKARRVARAVRLVAAFAAVAALLGVGAPVMARSVDVADVRPSTGLSDAGLAALASAAGTTADLHPALPRGYSVPRAAAPARPSVSTAASPASRPTATPQRATTVPKASTPAAPASHGGRLPLSVPVGSSTQVVTVVAPSSGSTTATVTAWQLGAGGWTAVVGPVSARIGSDGVGTASESLSRTPAGTFTLTEGFGRLADPGTRLPYRAIGPDDYWVSDAGPRYNQFYDCVSACPSQENLWAAGSAYDYAVVIDYNRRPAVPGKGSAFFLHVTNGAATAGCVAVPQRSLVAIMRWLNPAARPLISIGVG
jgi:L,D-peptidoglycan transpeptidase YkuD (ErfK/YbiS/YcfS/YnhG family)